MGTSPLSGLLKLPEYRETRCHIFQSDGALTWFVRQHRERLVKNGALLMLAGTWRAHEPSFDAVVLEVGQEAAHRRGLSPSSLRS